MAERPSTRRRNRDAWARAQRESASQAAGHSGESCGNAPHDLTDAAARVSDARKAGTPPNDILAQTDAFKADREIIHVDCDAGEINNRVRGCRAIEADIGAFLQAAAQQAAGRQWQGRPAWLAEIAALRDRWPDTAELAGVPGINPNTFMHQLSAASRPAAVQ